MKLGELKKSLGRFPPDMDDTEILVQFVEDNTEQLNADCLCFVGYTNMNETSAIILGTWKAADILREHRPNDFPANWKNRPDINLNDTDTQNEE